jgi:uncharacterized protein
MSRKHGSNGTLTANGVLTTNSNDAPLPVMSAGSRGFGNFFRLVSEGAGLTTNAADNDGVRRANEVVANALMSRAEMIRGLLDPRRDVHDSCGLTKGPILLSVYQFLFEREAVAARVVECLPRESWQVDPVVYEDERGDKPTAWEEAWGALGAGLRGGRSWFAGGDAHPINEWLQRADVQCGIGQYGVILMGIDDGRELWEPADMRGVDPPANLVTPTDGAKLPTNPGAAATRQLRYLRVFPESLANIVERETDKASPRLGQPTMYELVFNSPYSNAALSAPTGTATGVPQRVHWTRVVHVADNLESSELFGAPRMRPVYNNLYALMKLYHGSAEMYWMGAFPGIAITSNPQLQNSSGTRMPVEKLKDMMEAYFNDLQRWIALQGMDAKTLSPQVVSPRDQVDVQLEAICVKLGIPKRIFMGSERGELASSQDDASWNDRLRARQNGFITPRIIVPVVDHLIMLGCLPVPKLPLKVWWPDLDSQTAAEKAAVAVSRTTALGNYVAAREKGADEGYGWFDFLTRVLGHTEDEATVILETAAQEEEEKDAQLAAMYEAQAAATDRGDADALDDAQPDDDGTSMDDDLEDDDHANAQGATVAESIG